MNTAFIFDWPMLLAILAVLAYFELMRRVAPHAEEAGVGISMKPHGGISLTTEHLQAALPSTSPSGLTPSCSQASSLPVRPSPVWTSSAISITLCRRQIAARRSRSSLGSGSDTGVS